MLRWWSTDTKADSSTPFSGFFPSLPQHAVLSKNTNYCAPLDGPCYSLGPSCLAAPADAESPDNGRGLHCAPRSLPLLCNVGHGNNRSRTISRLVSSLTPPEQREINLREGGICHSRRQLHIWQKANNSVLIDSTSPAGM